MNLLRREARLFEELGKVLQNNGLSEDTVSNYLSQADLAVRKSEEHMLNMFDVEKMVLQCRDCYGKNLVTEHGPVTGRGQHDADILFIGLMPGDTEEKTGKIFTGPNSEVLTSHMTRLGIGTIECTVYAHNLVCCKPIGDSPRAAVVNNCSSYLAEIMYILEPNVVVPLGAKALSFILGKDSKMEDYEGEVLMQGRYVVVPIKHPSALHRIPKEADKQRAFEKYYEQLAGIKRMNDRIKKLRASKELPERGYTGSLFDDGKDTVDDAGCEQGLSHVQE
jgi:uracil-DNA glycosylase family 4